MAVLKTTFGYTPRDVLKRLSCEQIHGMIGGYNSYKAAVYGGAKEDQGETPGEIDWDEIDEVSEEDQLALMKAMGFDDVG